MIFCDDVSYFQNCNRQDMTTKTHQYYILLTPNLIVVRVHWRPSLIYSQMFGFPYWELSQSSALRFSIQSSNISLIGKFLHFFYKSVRSSHQSFLYFLSLSYRPFWSISHPPIHFLVCLIVFLLHVFSNDNFIQLFKDYTMLQCQCQWHTTKTRWMKYIISSTSTTTTTTTIRRQKNYHPCCPGEKHYSSY